MSTYISVHPFISTCFLTFFWAEKLFTLIFRLFFMFQSALLVGMISKSYFRHSYVSSNGMSFQVSQLQICALLVMSFSKNIISLPLPLNFMIIYAYSGNLTSGITSKGQFSVEYFEYFEYFEHFLTWIHIFGSILCILMWLGLGMVLL